MITIVVLIASSMSDKRNATMLINSNSSNNSKKERSEGFQPRRKEGFFATSQNAYIDPITGAIKGPGIMTDGMTRKPMDKMIDDIRSTGMANDDTPSLGVSVGDGFDKAYQSQLEIDAIDQKAVDGYQQHDALDQISRRIRSSENNFNNNFYNRGGSRPTKMILAPNEIRGVIDAKYLPDRDKNYQIATVNTAVPVAGYDVAVERLGEYLVGTHFSKVSHNAKTRSGGKKRIPTAAGATGGGARVNTKDTEIDAGESANADAVNQTISVEGDKAIVENNGDNVAIPLESTEALPESFRTRFVKGNHL